MKVLVKEVNNRWVTEELINVHTADVNAIEFFKLHVFDKLHEMLKVALLSTLLQNIHN